MDSLAKPAALAKTSSGRTPRRERLGTWARAWGGRGTLLLLSGWALGGCAYHFTNSHVSPPTGVHSIAVEAIYDTSREVLPHELLWQSLQNAFASDGHLRLVPVSEADALVRAHIKSASVAPDGAEFENGPVNDPEVFKGDSPPPPSSFKKLPETGKYRDKGLISLVVEVEVWNLNTRTLLMRRSYPVAAGFQAVHAPSITQTANDFLRYDESEQAAFAGLSDSIARSVVRDLLVR